VEVTSDTLARDSYPRPRSIPSVGGGVGVPGQRPRPSKVGRVATGGTASAPDTTANGGKLGAWVPIGQSYKKALMKTSKSTV